MKERRGVYNYSLKNSKCEKICEKCKLDIEKCDEIEKGGEDTVVLWNTLL